MAATLSGMHRIRDESSRARQPALALVTAFLLGAVLIVLTDFEHLRHIGTDPLASIGGALAGVLDGYPALFAGAIGDPGLVVVAIHRSRKKEGKPQVPYGVAIAFGALAILTQRFLNQFA